jgi:hypothetical protein
VSDPVTDLACALSVACATIDGALAQLAVDLASADQAVGGLADRHLAVAGAVNEIASNPEALNRFAAPSPWQSGALFGTPLQTRAAVLAAALRSRNTTNALEAFLHLRRDLEAYASGRVGQPLPDERALPRWDIRRACLPQHEEESKLAELDAVEAAEAKLRTVTKHVRFEVCGRHFDLPVPTDKEALKSRRWATALAEIGGLFDFSGLVDSGTFRRELQRLRDEIERVAAEHPQVSSILREYFNGRGIRLEAA